MLAASTSGADTPALDFVDVGTSLPQHYAFLVSESEFDEIMARIVGRGHLVEIITRPYGSGSDAN